MVMCGSKRWITREIPASDCHTDELTRSRCSDLSDVDSFWTWCLLFTVLMKYRLKYRGGKVTTCVNVEL